MKRLLKTSFVLCLALVCMCTALIKPIKNFNAIRDAKTVRDAIIAKNADSITKVLTRRSAKQRLDIAKAYKAEYKWDLDNEFGHVSDEDYKNLMVALVTPWQKYYAKALVSNDDELALLDILTSPNAGLVALDEAYKQISPGADLQEFMLKKELLTANVIKGALKGQRNETQEFDIKAVEADAKAIQNYSASIRKSSRTPDNKGLVENIFITRSHRHMRKMFEEYESLYEHNIDKAFDDKWFGYATGKSFFYMNFVFTSIPRYYAKRLYVAMAGFGTSENMLTRIIVSRSEIDLDKIANVFKTMMNDKLTTWISDERLGDDYKKALLAIVDS